MCDMRRFLCRAHAAHLTGGPDTAQYAVSVALPWFIRIARLPQRDNYRCGQKKAPGCIATGGYLGVTAA